jgi:hypothetical protein
VLRGVRGTASMGGEPKPDRYSELVKQALDSGPVSRAPSSIHHESTHGTCALPLYCALPQSSQSSRPLTDSNVASYFLLFSRGACCTPCATLTKIEYGAHACGVVWCGVVWCGVVWCGAVRCGVVWCGAVRCCDVRFVQAFLKEAVKKARRKLRDDRRNRGSTGSDGVCR